MNCITARRSVCFIKSEMPLLLIYDGPNGSFFTSIRILNSEFRIPNSEFRILHFEKNVYRNFVFGYDTSGSVQGVGPFDLKLEQFKQ